jgi:hypothetical protein
MTMTDVGLEKFAHAVAAAFARRQLAAAWDGGESLHVPTPQGLAVIHLPRFYAQLRHTPFEAVVAQILSTLDQMASVPQQLRAARGQLTLHLSASIPAGFVARDILAPVRLAVVADLPDAFIPLPTDLLGDLQLTEDAAWQQATAYAHAHRRPADRQETGPAGQIFAEWRGPDAADQAWLAAGQAPEAFLAIPAQERAILLAHASDLGEALVLGLFAATFDDPALHPLTPAVLHLVQGTVKGHIEGVHAG